MNWYHIFYWATVADGIKNFCNAISILLLVMFIISCIGFFVSAFNTTAHLEMYGTTDKDYLSWAFWTKTWRRTFTSTMILGLLFGLGSAAIPSRKDALIIIAGGAVGNFITSDNSAKQLPAELTTLLRDKIREEIKEVRTTIITDTLASKSKEELIEILKNKK